jgi:hypothetical protein
MMREFSQRTIAGLKQYKLFSVLLPPFRSFLEINLEKEIDKHRELVACAWESARQGRMPDAADAARLLHQAREIDRAFLQKAQSLSSAIRINYAEIDQIRQRRIELVLTATIQVLSDWRGARRLRRVLQGFYTREQFHALLQEILDLYIRETGALSKAVKIPRPLVRFRESLIGTVDAVMRKTAAQLASDLTDQVYREARGQ